MPLSHCEDDRVTITYDFSPQAVAQKMDALLTQLHAAITARQEYIYLLIDREALPDDVMHPFICALVDHRPAPVRLPHRNLSVDRHPWLVPLNLTDAAHHALLVNSIRHALEEQHPDRLCNGGGRAVCGWLTSPYDTAVAVKQLGHTAIQRLVSGQQILLRYYDPAIHHILWAQLGNLQRDRWLGGLSGWHFLNGDGQLVSHCHTASPYPLMTFSLMLSPEDEDGIRQAGDIVRILESYRLINISQHRHDESTAISIIREALSRARHLHGFEDEADQRMLALDCLRLHPYLDNHPRLKILLSPHEREPGTGYATCVAGLSDQDWQRICHEINTEKADALASGTGALHEHVPF
ncbi:TPA: DUF4123 domain-containing protein [Cronobacter sakazakii]|nr:DUF4123 domain-containing protein [Cronobacter sakazakii]PQY19725.1 DUF4123 domain-containing protein [Cronobacter sakazakii]RHW64109.1 DUF4123 domain-containing protein [Cronobacter sakazakii]HAU5438951.1 DUF4123 domain-containing protein [Cronobacter sakazakii]HAU5484782.1 DUF4123 domain-containing protein [Cronobacter sakazakii]